MRPSSNRSWVRDVVVLLAIVSPFIWLAAWPHDHPITSWAAVAILAVAAVAAAVRAR